MTWQYLSLLRKNRQLLTETSERQLTESKLRSANEELRHRVRNRSKKLEKITERFSGLFDSINSGIVVHAPDTSITLCNAKATELLGLQHDEPRGVISFNPAWQFMDEASNLLRVEQYPVNQIITTGKPVKGMLTGIIKPMNKEITWVLVNGIPLFDSQGEFIEIIMSYVDVTKLKIAKERLDQAATVFANTAEGVIISDLKGNIVDVNQAFTLITGYSKEEIIGKNPRLLQSGRHNPEFYEEMWTSLIETEHWRGEIWNRRKNGEVYPELLTISRITDKQNKTVGYVGVFSDITTLKESEKKMEYLAHHDALTDLPNRLLFNSRLDQSIKHAARQKTRLALVFVDLDRFKTINDSLGHPVGDALLKQISQRLLHAVRADDTVARISGDEFIILLENVISAENTAIVVDKLMTTFREPFKVEENEVRMTCSMGISLYPDDSEDASKLLQYADAAMYLAKENGRNSYQFYTQELTAAAYEHVFIENAMRGAIEKGEFSVVYQPQVDLNSNEIIGMESLIRWQHPKLGALPPARFIPIAEKTGLIREIGEWVLKTTCQQARLWIDKGLRFGYIAVNVSGQQIQAGNFSALVEKVLKQSNVPPGCIELEVTESFVMMHTEGNIQQLESIQALGIKLAIDDFGTGYSSLSYLKSLPIDKIKIDQSFVRDIPDDPNDMAISEAVILMGKALNLKIIAEGIETHEQLSFFRDKGCDCGQGDFFSYPVPAAEIEKLISRGKLG